MSADENYWRVSRRDLLGIGAAMPAAATLGCATQSALSSSESNAMFRTRLCDVLGIRFPIIQSGMGRIAGAELAAAVSNSGGLGILAGLNLSAQDLRNQIRDVRKRTERPFGVNLWLHTELSPPVDASRISDDIVQAVQAVLNRFRQRLGIPTTTARPGSNPDLINAALDVILDERVPVWSIGLGNPTPEMVRRCRERGVKIVAMVATVEDARAVERSGVDVIVAQGSEAGGHRSTWVKPSSRDAANVGTIALVPQVVDAVKVPVVAAGGIVDGRGLAAALALGASGVLLGTRFVATRESGATEFYKKALLERDSNETTVTDAFTGLYARALRNRFTEEYSSSGAPVLPALVQSRAAGDIFAAAASQKNGDYYPMWAGQGIGMMHDLPSAADVVPTMIREAAAAVAALKRRDIRS